MRKDALTHQARQAALRHANASQALNCTKAQREVAPIKTAGKTIRNVLAALFICVAVFTAVQTLAFSIPSSLFVQNVQKSANELTAEGEYSYLLPNREDCEIDGATIAVMLNIATAQYDNPLDGVANDYWWRKSQIENPDQYRVESFADSVGRSVDDNASWKPYRHYWHGYVSVIRPFLIFTSLNGIRLFFMLVFALLLFASAYLLAKRENALVGALYFLSFFVIHGAVAMVSLPFAFSFFIALVACLFVLLNARKKRNSWSFKVPPQSYIPRWATFFFVVGAVTVFFDFLDNPIITLGCPLLLLLYLNRELIQKHTVIKALALTLGACVFWVLGYGLSLLANWIISSAITGLDIVAAGFSQVDYRTNDWTSNKPTASQITTASVLRDNVRLLKPYGWLFALITVVAVVSFAVLQKRNSRAKAGGTRIVVNYWWIVPVLVVAVLPYVWYVLVVNHSFVHSWFTYRNQLITIIAAMLIASEPIDALWCQIRTRKFRIRD